MNFFQTYGLGMLIASSYFGLHSLFAALKTSCRYREREHWSELALLLTGTAMVYAIGLMAWTLSEIL
jgi:hypothetical protein